MLASLPRGYPLHSIPSIPPTMHFRSIHCHLLSLCIESPQFIHVHHQHRFLCFIVDTIYFSRAYIIPLFSSFPALVNIISPLSCWSIRIHHQQTPHVDIGRFLPFVSFTSVYFPLPLPKRPRDTLPPLAEDSPL